MITAFADIQSAMRHVQHAHNAVADDGVRHELRRANLHLQSALNEIELAVAEFEGAE